MPLNSVSFEALDKALWLGVLPSSHLLGAGTRKYTIIHVLGALDDSGDRVVKQGA